MAVTRIEIANVVKRFGFERAVANVSLTLQAGSVCALLGHNGAGKTTLLGMLSTLVAPTSGQVTFFDGAQPLASGAPLRRQIGLLAHASLCYGELSAIENLTLFAKLYDVAASQAAAVLAKVGLDPKAQQRPAKTYSRGMMQRLALARALLPSPSVVLLDEPFTGLDRDGAFALGKTIGELKADGAVVVVITHDLEAIAGFTDHVALLRRGVLAHQARADAAHGFSYDQLKAFYHQYGGAA